MMTETTRYETAKECAGEALDALCTVYWADSFDTKTLRSRLTETIQAFTRNARSLEEAPEPEWIADNEQPAQAYC
jgi:hypothetical protein